jgi:hypothetical protein
MFLGHLNNAFVTFKLHACNIYKLAREQSSNKRTRQSKYLVGKFKCANTLTNLKLYCFCSKFDRLYREL